MVTQPFTPTTSSHYKLFPGRPIKDQQTEHQNGNKVEIKSTKERVNNLSRKVSSKSLPSSYHFITLTKGTHNFLF